mmetsp:Transcript_7538/g.21343  ORF Transcript_7538/g.21343 Transcript_7538/m.21343 type:complete len:237 (+) Transcript_7538:246-956(+)
MRGGQRPVRWGQRRRADRPAPVLRRRARADHAAIHVRTCVERFSRAVRGRPGPGPRHWAQGDELDRRHVQLHLRRQRCERVRLRDGQAGAVRRHCGQARSDWPWRLYGDQRVHAAGGPHAQGRPRAWARGQVLRDPGLWKRGLPCCQEHPRQRRQNRRGVRDEHGDLLVEWARPRRAPVLCSRERLAARLPGGRARVPRRPGLADPRARMRRARAGGVPEADHSGERAPCPRQDGV